MDVSGTAQAGLDHSGRDGLVALAVDQNERTGDRIIHERIERDGRVRRDGRAPNLVEAQRCRLVLREGVDVETIG